MRLLLRLYPAWWRSRYGVEAVDIWEGRPLTPSLMWNVVAGAVDAWLSQEAPPERDDTSQRETEGGYLMNNSRRHRLVAPVVGGIGAMVLVGAVSFVETWRTIHGHPDGAPLTMPTLIAGVFGMAGVAIGLRWRRRRPNR
jgi:hypothetical protein